MSRDLTEVSVEWQQAVKESKVGSAYRKVEDTVYLRFSDGTTYRIRSSRAVKTVHVEKWDRRSDAKDWFPLYGKSISAKICQKIALF